MNKINSVEDLGVFKKAHMLTLELYKATMRFPKEEKFGLISQIRRSSASIASNLMEGSYRINRKEFRQFVGIAYGSAGELKYHLLLSRDLGYIDNEEFNRFIPFLNEICKMLRGLIKSLSLPESPARNTNPTH